MTIFKLGKYKIDHKSKPFIIAELSANHNGKLSNIYSLIDKAKKSGDNRGQLNFLLGLLIFVKFLIL